MLDRLDHETRAYHVEADHGWLSMMTPTVTPGRYAEELMRTYGFEAPVEAALSFTRPLQSILDVPRLTRSGLIAQDLMVLGFGPGHVARLPQCHTITPFAEATEAFGWTYVIERATLLHDALYKHLSTQLEASGNAFSYLDISRRSAVARWHALGAALDKFAPTRDIADRIVEAAHAAFQTLLRWRREWEAGAVRTAGAAPR
jgi:heme oxygenase (biliverdin-IX-beta and delta-forming)